MGSSDLPAYFKEWHGQRVEWPHGQLKGKQCIVTDVERVVKDHHVLILVNVLRDDGFLEPKARTDDLARIRDGNHALVKVDGP